MKIREDFVTNSSSSSFIIAYKKPQIDMETLKTYPFLEAYINIVEKILTTELTYAQENVTALVQKQGSDTHLCFVSDPEREIEIEAWIKKWWSTEEPERYKNIISDLAKKGYTIFDKEIDRNNEYCEELLTELEETIPEHLKLLWIEAY